MRSSKTAVEKSKAVDIGAFEIQQYIHTSMVFDETIYKRMGGPGRFTFRIVTDKNIVSPVMGEKRKHWRLTIPVARKIHHT